MVLHHYTVLSHYFTLCKTLVVNVYIHITINGTLSYSCLLTACFTIYVEYITILRVQRCLYTNIYMPRHLATNTFYWVDTLLYTCMKK